MKVGIDLGTTNSALAWVDPREAEDVNYPPIHIFEVPQLVAPGKIEPRRTLPSFMFLEDGRPVGVYAREQGALVPTRLVHSAKSWLSNPDVDRTAKILPWDSQETGRVLSPVEVSSEFLRKFREAWDQKQGAPLADQDIVLTVPASFDEEARELTVMAAAEAGLPKLTLLEEPVAAFYFWIANNFARSRKLLYDGQVLLVCDVGGATSDFSLIRGTRDGDRVDFTRTTVGRHLLLGGDNLDLTLAWLVETKLGVPLSIRQRSGLRRQCTAAKERLLSDPHLKSVEITVLGAGRALVGGSLKTEILREEALELTLEGFLPITERGDAPKDEKRSLFRELGLPYVTDPAITKHLNAFLEGAAQQPDAILFNGGFFIPEICRERVADAVGHWYGKRPEILENRDLDLAVATGAAYYSYVRSTGSGVLVRGGLPRTYYLGIGQPAEDKIAAVCLVPRGAEEGATLEIDRDDLQLVANRPVSFRLYSSLTRTEDQPGQVLEFAANDESLHTHAPLHAVIRFGKSGERLIPVKVGARLTEIGTLETWCESKISDQRWRLQFELRKHAGSISADSVCVPASDFPATISAWSRRAASTPAVCSTPTRCSAKSTGGFSGAVSPAASTATSRRISTSASRRSCFPAAARNPRGSIAACCARCGAPPPALNCCPSRPAPNSARRWFAASRQAPRANPSSGASRASARASCSMRPSIRCCRPPRSRDGWKRCCPRPPPPKLWHRSDAAPTIQPAIFPPPRAKPCDRSWRRSHASRSCSPFSMVKKRATNAHWVVSSAKSCRRVWCCRRHWSEILLERSRRISDSAVPR